MPGETGSVLILGSGPNAPQAAAWARDRFAQIVVINNAWQVRPDWSHLILPEDFPDDRRPGAISASQQIVGYSDYIPQQNRYGGIVYTGGTMAFTAGYWALGALRPRVLAFMGCDMVYPKTGNTHFYGTGAADPLRDDVTLQSLEAKSARLWFMAARQGAACVNLSHGSSRLVFPRTTPQKLDQVSPKPLSETPGMIRALKREAELAYAAPSGRYWECLDKFDPMELAAVDTLWLTAYREYLSAVA